MKSSRQKDFNDLKNIVYKLNKVDECMLCGNKMSSACKSHTIPQFVLKNIAEDGKLVYGQEFANVKNLFDCKKGVSNAHVFRLICAKCDDAYFKCYENKDFILNYNQFDLSKRNRCLSSIAVKSQLSAINVNMFVGTLRKLPYPNRVTFSFEDVDIAERRCNIDMLKKKRNSLSEEFVILYNSLLDYKLGFATQAPIALYRDFNDNIMFDNHSLEVNNIDYLYLIVFPDEEKTRVMLYVSKEYINLKTKAFVDDFLSYSEEEKLHIIFVMMIMYTEQFFMSPSVYDKISKDKVIRKLYIKTDTDGNYPSVFKELKNYKKYNNYFKR